MHTTPQTYDDSSAVHSRFEVFSVTDSLVPGEIDPGEGDVTLNENRETTEVRVANTGDRPAQIGSHFHFFEANRALSFDRKAAFGMRLNIPAGTAVRFEPGEEQTVELVAIGGKRRAHGMNSLVDGSTTEGHEAVFARARDAGYDLEPNATEHPEDES